MSGGRLARSLHYAGLGFSRAWRQQGNLRIELTIGLLALAMALWLGAPLSPILLAGGLVLAMELFNSAIEALVDLVSPGHHELAGAAKDLAAAGVLVAAVVAVLVGLTVLGPPLLARLGQLLGGA